MHLRIPLRPAIVLVLLVALLLPALPAAAAPEYQSGGVHVVQRGESLSQIARRYGVSTTALAQANGISNPNLVYAGQRLAIPGGSTGTAAGSTAASSSVHVVRPGESLSGIAARYGTTAAALARANNLANPNNIYVGQRLVISGSGAAARPPASQPAASSGRWIDINLSTQTLTAYEGSRAVFSTLVSTGSTYPTPPGTYTILYRVRSQRMTGPGYDLPNVPWVMYFTNRGHAIHGAYWHNNFGRPMSHGCVNMRPGEAEWLYNFTPNGAKVVIHY